MPPAFRPGLWDVGDCNTALASLQPEPLLCISAGCLLTLNVRLCRDGKSAAKAAAEIPSDAVEELFYVAGGAAAWEVRIASIERSLRTQYVLQASSGCTLLPLPMPASSAWPPPKRQPGREFVATGSSSGCVPTQGRCFTIAIPITCFASCFWAVPGLHGVEKPFF